MDCEYCDVLGVDVFGVFLFVCDVLGVDVLGVFLCL